MHPLSTRLITCLALCASATGSIACSDKSKASETDDDDDGRSRKKEKKKEKPKSKAIELVMQDITEQVKPFVPEFDGKKIEMKLPKGVKFGEAVGGFTAALDPKEFELEVCLAHRAATVAKEVGNGKSLFDGAKITERGDEYVIVHGKYMGQTGHGLTHDVVSLEGLETGCRTHVMRLYSEKRIRTMLEACQSLKVTK